MIIGNAKHIKNENIQLQLLICGLNFLEPAVDKVLHVQARAAHEMFVWGIKSLIKSGYQYGVCDHK